MIRDDRTIRRVTSPTHAIEVTGAGTTEARVRVRVRSRGDSGGELGLRWELGDEAWKLSAHAHRDGGQLGYAVVTVAAPPLAADPGQDLTVVLDASASMAGEALQEARVAAGRIVQRLRGVDRFNVVVMQGEARSLFPLSAVGDARGAGRRHRPAPRRERGRARRSGQGALPRARAAGSDAAAQDHPPPHGRSQRRRSALRVAAEDRGTARIFTVGFGRGVDRPALSRLAAIKRGRFTLVEGADVLDGRIDQLSRQIAAPGLTHLSLEARGGTLLGVYPLALPDLYPGQDLRILARVDAAGQVLLTLHADAVGSGPVSLATTIDVARGPRRPWIGKLWARERVSDLLEEMALTGENDRLKQETIELALGYNIVTPYTSFLAIPATEVLTPQAAATLAEARRLKAAVMARTPDALAVMSPGGGAAGAPSADMAMPMAMPSPPVQPTMAPPEAPGRLRQRPWPRLRRVRGGGRRDRPGAASDRAGGPGAPRRAAPPEAVTRWQPGGTRRTAAAGSRRTVAACPPGNTASSSTAHPMLEAGHGPHHLPPARPGLGPRLRHRPPRQRSGPRLTALHAGRLAGAMVELPATTVRLALPADAGAIARVQVASWRAAYAGLMPEALLAGLSVEKREAAWRDRLEHPQDPERRLFVVEVSGEVLGFASTGGSRDEDAEPGTAEVLAVYLAPAAWGRGLGRALFGEAVDDLRARGWTRVTLWVLEGNGRAIRFYESAGMRPDGGAKVEVEEGAPLPHVRYLLPLGPPARG